MVVAVEMAEAEEMAKMERSLTVNQPDPEMADMADLGVMEEMVETEALSRSLYIRVLQLLRNY